MMDLRTLCVFPSAQVWEQFLSRQSRRYIECFKKTEQHVPEGLEELDKLNEAHCAVRYHEVLKALETALPPAVPRPAAPRPDDTTVNSQYLRLTETRRLRFFTAALIFANSYPGCALAAPERVGEDCGRDWLHPATLVEEDEEEEQAAGSPGILLEERENGPGKLSSVTEAVNNSQEGGCGFSGTTVQR